MKISMKLFAWTFAAGITFVALPFVFWNLQFDGINGYYYLGRCGCNHAIYCEIRGDKWYQSCPGHHERKCAGNAVKNGDKWIIESKGRVSFTIRAHGSHNLLFSESASGPQGVSKLANPYELWFEHLTAD